MELDLIWQLAFIGGLVGFGVWHSYLTFKLHEVLDEVGHRGDDIDEIRHIVEVVANLLERLPEIMPQFGIHQSPLQPLIEMFAQKMIQNQHQTLHTGSAPLRGEDGKYAPKEDEITT